MLAWFNRLLTPPVFAGDEDKARAAWLLNSILLVFLVCALLFLGLTSLLAPAHPTYFVPLVALLLGMMFLLRRGYLRLASALTVINVWLSQSALICTNSGIRSAGILNYIFSVLIAGLLLGRGAALATAGASILAGLLMWQAGSNGWLAVPPLAAVTIEPFTLQAIGLLLAAVLVTLALSRVEEVLARMRVELNERRRLEEEQRTIRQQYETLVQSIDGIVWEADPSDFRFLFVSRQAERILGYPVEAWLTQPDFWRTHTHADDLAWTSAFCLAATERREDHQFEYRMIAADGRVVWLSDLVTVHVLADQSVRLRGVMVDITERKRAEAALQASEERFAKAFNLNPLRMGIVRLKDGVILDINERWLRDWGFERQAIVGHSFFELEAVLSEEMYLVAHPILQAGQPFRDRENKIRTRNGEQHTSITSGELIELGGEPCLLWVTNDISERKRIEEALRASEERFFKTFEFSPLPMIIVRIKDGAVLNVNACWVREMGYAREEIVGQPLTEMKALLGSEEARVRRLINEGQPFRDHEFRLTTKAGAARVVLGSAALIEIAGEPCLIGTVNDITQRNRAEEARRASEARFAIAFNATPIPLTISALADGRLLDVNDSFLRMSGCTRAEVIGHSAVELNLWDDPAERAHIMQRLRTEGQVRDAEVHLRRRDGETRLGLLSIVAIELEERPCLLFAVSDITERARAEEAVRESEARFRELTEHIREVFYMATPDLSKSLYISPAYETIWGRTCASLRQNPRSFLEAIHPEDQPRILSFFSQQVEQDFELEYRVVRPDGSVRWILDRGFPIKDAAGQIYRIAGLAEDITESKLSEEQLKTTMALLRALTAKLRSAREEEGIRIAREIHDELGSSLSSLRWNLESFDKALAKVEHQPPIQALREQIAAMFGLTDTTISTVRRIASELRPSMLDDFGLSEALEWQAEQFQARTGIHCQYDCRLPELSLGKEQSTALFRIFQEALTNVLRHAQATRIEVTLEERAGTLRLTISDDGKGITTEQQSGLQSLGLLGMRERAQLIGGRLRIAGRTAGGTVVTVLVPLPHSIPGKYKE